MRLNFQVQGDGFPLIILHGFLGSLDNWRSVSKGLSKSYKVYNLDLRNHGEATLRLAHDLARGESARWADLVNTAA